MTLKFQSKDEARAWDLYAAAFCNAEFDHVSPTIEETLKEVVAKCADTLLEERRKRMECEKCHETGGHLEWCVFHETDAEKAGYP